MPLAITPSAVRALADVAKPYRARQGPAGSSKPARLQRAGLDGSPDRTEAPRGGRPRHQVIPGLLKRFAMGTIGVLADPSEGITETASRGHR